MRLDFNVLWVDDQPRAIDAQRIAIKNRMEDEGFEFKPTLCTSLKDLQDQVTDAVFDDQVDLILVDWNLGGEDRGEAAILQIREKIRFKDVIFYSGENNAKKLRQLAFDNNLEGVFCSSREDLVDEVIGVFDSLVKKVLDLDHTRGIVMGATSDIDYMIRDCIEAMFEKISSEHRDKMAAKTLAVVEERLTKSQNQLSNLKANPQVSAMFKAHNIVTANDWLRTLKRVISLAEFNELSEMDGVLTEYMNDVVPKRNSLGHQVLAPGGKMGIARIEDATVVTLDEMRELRRRILNLRGDFRRMHQSLRPR